MTTPIARPSDPWTSHIGAAEVTESGRRKTQSERLLAVVQSHPGLTGGEISELAGLERWATTKRLSDLKNAGQAIQGEPRHWHGRPQVTWWPVQQQGQLL